MKHDYRIRAERITLYPLQQKDLEPLRNLRNRERRWFLDNTFITQEQQKKWYERYLQKEDDIMFKLEYKMNSGLFCGAIAVYNIDTVEKTCEIGRTLVDKSLVPEKGIGREATCGICRFAFEVLGMEKIRTQILKSNERSAKLHERVGFYRTEDYGADAYMVELTQQTILY